MPSFVPAVFGLNVLRGRLPPLKHGLPLRVFTMILLLFVDVRDSTVQLWSRLS